MIQVDISNIWGALSLPDLLAIEKEVADAHAMLSDEAGETDAGEVSLILDAAEKIRSDSDVCVVLGIGLEARAAIELLQGRNRNLRKKPQIFFAGNSLSTRQWKELTGLLEGKDFSVIVISSSGTTLEPALALRGLRWMLERKYGTDEASSRIYAVTDPEQGALYQMASQEQWQIFSLPTEMDRGTAPLSAAGLLPMAVAGIDIQQVLKGAAEAWKEYNLRSFENPLWLYAGVRNALYRRGKVIEVLESFEPDFHCFGRWWQQLFARSGGGAGQGIFPATGELPGACYSLGRLIRQGQHNLFETVVRFAPEEQPVAVCSQWKNLDGLGHLEGKTLDEVEETVFQDMVCAHTDEGVPVVVMDCGVLNEQTLGGLFCFLELSCGLCACILGVDTFRRSGNGGEENLPAN